MGKSRKSKLKSGQRADPIAKPVKPPSDPELAALRDAKILPVLKDLQSTEPKKRITAARAIANIVQDPKCRKLLLREQIVHRVLTETLTDNSLESKAAGWYILKLLVQEEEADFCIHLYRQDILTAIEYAAENVSSTLVPGIKFAKLSKVEQQFIWDIAGCLVVLVSALAEAGEEVMKAIDGLAMVPNLLTVLVTSESCPLELLEDTMTCLLVLSEDNQSLADVIQKSESGLFERLIMLKDSNRLVSVPACGILHNLFSALGWHDSSEEETKTDAILVPSLAAALDSESGSSGDILQLALEVLASIATNIQAAMESGAKGSKDKAPKKHSDEWNGIDDEEGDEKMDEGDQDGASDGGSEDGDPEDDEMDDDEMAADIEMVTGADHDSNGVPGIEDLPTLKEYIRSAVPPITRLAAQQPKSDKDTMLQSHAIAALNNLAWSVSCIDFSNGENVGILKAWKPVARKIWDSVVAPVLATDTADVNLATKTTGLAWALARTIRGSISTEGNPHKKFMALYQATKSMDGATTGTAGDDPEEQDPMQSLGVKCIGVLGQLAQVPMSIPINREIGVFLVRVLSALPETPVAEAIEAVDQIFDLYSDEEAPWDREVFWKDNFLQHLEEAAPKLKAAAKKIDKRTMFELRSRADEASLNLTRLLQYKRKHRPGHE